MKTNIKIQIMKNILSFLSVTIILLALSTNCVFSQNIESYFEQQGSIIAVEAEKALGFGWTKDSNSGASGGLTVFVPQTDTLTFQVSDDSYVDLYNRNTPFGSQTQLLVDGKGEKHRGFFMTPWWDGKVEAFEKAAFLKFIVTGLSDIIIEAKVYLYCLDSGIGGGIYELDPIVDDLNWTESQATWNNRPSTHIDANTFQDYVGSVSAGNWYAFDVTQALYGRTDGVYSFGIVMQDDQYTAWSSKEGAQPPFLEIRVKSSGTSLAGNVRYYSNDNPIENVILNITGGSQDSQNSGIDGGYYFNNLLSNQNYLLQASKTEDTDIGPFDITTYDAAITAQAAVGIRELSDFERIAADVSLDGELLTFDAALIAQYSVGLPKTTASHVGEWDFEPADYYYENLSENKTNQDFTGILLGNVHGGWSQPGRLSGTGMSIKKYDKLEELTVEPGDEFEIPFELAHEDIISLDIDFTYDASVMRFKGTVLGDLGNDAEMFYYQESGRIRVGIYSIVPLPRNRDVVSLKFEVIGEKGQKGFMSLDKFQLNNEILMKSRSQLVVGLNNEIPLKFNLHQNYPNPLIANGNNSYGSGFGTKIMFELPKQTDVKLTIYNCLGQKVRTLIRGFREAGSHHVNWNGFDESGNLVSAGLYFYRLETPNRIAMKRMVLLR
ncbi:hypothetical protein B6I21_05730 [candidate division KSB1 bacterium 4572_119]|nr:MAG: hypothetical protein B6I21_05730 [candidate division KSB1 bacterium 4572_119]